MGQFSAWRCMFPIINCRSREHNRWLRVQTNPISESISAECYVLKFEFSWTWYHGKCQNNFSFNAKQKEIIPHLIDILTQVRLECKSQFFSHIFTILSFEWQMTAGQKIVKFYDIRLPSRTEAKPPPTDTARWCRKNDGHLVDTEQEGRREIQRICKDEGLCERKI